MLPLTGLIGAVSLTVVDPPPDWLDIGANKFAGVLPSPMYSWLVTGIHKGSPLAKGAVNACLSASVPLRSCKGIFVKLLISNIRSI
jgi:hypothetical protein